MNISFFTLERFFILHFGFNFVLMKYIVNGLKMNCIHFVVCNNWREVNNETLLPGLETESTYLYPGAIT